MHARLGVARAEPEKRIRSLVQADTSTNHVQRKRCSTRSPGIRDRHPERLQVHLYGDAGELELDYAAIRSGAAACASRLAAHGLQPGQTVAIMLPTGRDYLFSFFGILMAGGIPVPLLSAGATGADRRSPAAPRRHPRQLPRRHADHHSGSENRGPAAALSGWNRCSGY